MYLRWSYNQKVSNVKFGDFENERYGEIVLKKNSIQANSLYFAMKVWDDADGGFKIGNIVAEGQEVFQKLPQTHKEKDELKQSYFSKLDVSKLLSSEVQELSIKYNMLSKEGEHDCFTYTVKVRVKE